MSYHSTQIENVKYVNSLYWKEVNTYFDYFKVQGIVSDFIWIGLKNPKVVVCDVLAQCLFGPGTCL